MSYDIVIIGSGMIGSAAAYHASCIKNNYSICLVGPPEPKNRKESEVFGSWYDEGRICRMASDMDTWSILAVQSMMKFNQLEKQSGIQFYNESGYVMATQDPEDYQKVTQVIRKNNLSVEDVSRNWKEYFNFLSLPEDAFVLWEKEMSGHISPRNIIAACQKIATEDGADILHDVVYTIKPIFSSDEFRWNILTEGEKSLQAKCVLVATGAFAPFKDLFKYVAPNSVPDLDLRTQTVAYLRISADEANRLKDMPTIVTKCPYGDLDGAYILPPILYPDGRWYLKLGHGRAFECKKNTFAEVVEWFKSNTGIPECVEKLSQLLCHMLPGLQVEEVSGDGCVTSHTPDVEPYIDMVAEGFGVALGGNGYAAKACLEIGRLAAHLTLLDEWSSNIPRDRLKMKWKSNRS